MGFRPNHDAARWFVDEIFPGVRAARPEARFWVVGHDPSASLVAANYEDQRVVVTGAVPSTAPYWERAGVYVLPMRIGGGVRYKALEAMARGCPLVSTRLGMEGTGAMPDRDYLAAERSREFAAAIVRLLEDETLARRLAASARKTVAEHDLERIRPRLLTVYEEIEAGRVAV
jgi:glycosyltransferase involved in cell wall biosynthesis